MTGSPCFSAWIDRCQLFSGRPSSDPAAAGLALVDLVAALPSGLSAAQQDVARTVLNAAWARVLGSALAQPSVVRHHTAGDARVVRALAAIDRRFAEPRFSLQTLARELAVSGCRLTRLLKLETGRTFGAHLHARRVDEARALLAASSLSVKEVAARVGYATTTQLDRHFKRCAHALPSAFRAAMRGDAPRAGVPRAR